MNRISAAGWLGFAAGLALTGGMLQAETDPLNLLTPHNEVAAVEAPPRIVFSTYLGGSGQDSGDAVTVDESGNVYVGGSTDSADIPGTAGGYDWPPYAPYPRSDASSFRDGFVTKLAPDGSLRFTAFVGGPWSDSIWGITMGASSVYLAGRAMGPDSSNAWVAWLSKEAVGPGGVFFEYYLGEYWTYWPYAADIALDPSGNMIVTGGRGMMCGVGDPVGTVVKLDGDNIRYFTFLEDIAWSTYALVVDEHGYAYIVGYKLNWMGQAACFPPMEGDALVAKLDPNGEVVWQRTFGEAGNDFAHDIALSPEGILYVLGTFGDPGHPDRQQPFLAALTLAGDVLYSVELEASNVAVDRAGGLYLWTGSSVVRLDPRNLRVIRSADLPGASVRAFAVDAGGNAVLTGVPGAGFPVVNAFQPGPGGAGDAFVTKIAMNRPPDCSAAVVSPSTLGPPNGKLIPIGVHGITEADGDPFTLIFTEVRQDEPLSRPGTPDATGVGTGALFLRSDRAGKEDGRVYHVAFEARDVLGAACAGKITVCVPHDARNGAACGDGGGVVDSSFGG